MQTALRKLVSTNSVDSSILEIYNAFGSLIYTVQTVSDKTEIDLDKYSSGIYFVKMTNQQGSLIRKIIKE